MFLIYKKVCVRINKQSRHIPLPYAEVVKLADALDSKSSDSDIMSVRVRPPAPNFLRTL